MRMRSTNSPVQPWIRCLSKATPIALYMTPKMTVSQKMLPSGCLIQATFLRTNLSSRIHSTGLGHFCLYVTDYMLIMCLCDCLQRSWWSALVLLLLSDKRAQVHMWLAERAVFKASAHRQGKQCSFFFNLRYCCGSSFTALHFVLMQVRVATEGINGTVGGTKAATSLYIKAMLAHPIFQVMQVKDFKVNKQKSTLFHGAVHFCTK